MSKEKILHRKFEQLNELKGSLVFRSSENKKDIVKKIKDVVDELTLVLEDFNYIRDSEEESAHKRIAITMAEVQAANGKGNNPAYVIISGTVYDVTGVKAWSGGTHQGLSAGTDVTSNFMSCHGGSNKILSKLRVVGVLSE